MKFADGTYATDTLAKQTEASTTTATTAAAIAPVAAGDLISHAANDNFVFKPSSTSDIAPHGETGVAHTVDAAALVSNVGVNAALHHIAAAAEPDHFVDHAASASPGEAPALTAHHDVFLV
jgi:hypothetical protein